MAEYAPQSLPNDEGGLLGFLGLSKADQKRIQRRAMAGLDPLPEDAAKLAAALPDREQRGEDLGTTALVSAVPYGGVLRAVAAAPKLTGAAAGLLSYFGGAREATPSGNADLTEVRKQLQDVGSPELTRLQKEMDSLKSQIQQQLEMEVKGSKQMTAKNEAVKPLQDRLNDLTRLYGEERTRVAQEATDRANAVMTARAEGETARDRERAKTAKPFVQYYNEDLRGELPMLPPPWALPAVAGAAGVAALRGMSIPSAWWGRYKAQDALKGKDYDLAKSYADTHRYTGKTIVDDAVTGAASGATLGTLPLVADAITQNPANPEKAAQEAYVRELLPIDPRRAQAEASAAAMPNNNPAYDKVRDWTSWARGLGGGAIEGASAGKLTGLLAAGLKPGFRNVDAVVSANAPKAGPVPPPKPQPNGPPNPLANTQGSYPPPGSPERDYIRDEYRRSVLNIGQPLNTPSAASKSLQQRAAAVGGSLPAMTGRIKQTDKAIEAFVAQNGRLPISQQEWAQFVYRNTGTLGLLGLMGAASQMPTEE